MKNKIIIFLILITLIGASLFFAYKNNVIQNIINKKEVNNTIKNNVKPKEKTIKNKQENKIKNIKIEPKISEFKKILKARGLIISGDIHLKNDEYLFALKKFLDANKQTPNNPKILAKIAETYFLMKNYKQAYKYYSKVNNEKYLDKEKKTLSFLYSQNIENFKFQKNASGSLSSKSINFLENIKKTIDSFNLDKDNNFYYKNSIDCLNSFHLCKQNFENYFKNTNYSAKNKNLENIRQAIINYKNFKQDKLYYKNALIIGAFLQNKNYPIAIILAKDLLKQKPNYKPMLQIIAQSYFELNKIDVANKYLLEYEKLDSKDPSVSYMLGVIAQKKHLWEKSNIFLKIAIEKKYKDLADIYRLMIYNYFILDKQDKIDELFDKLIATQKTPEFNDLLLATYYNIIHNHYKKAILYADKGIKLYPQKEDFYGFKAWILIEQDKLTQAQILLQKAEKINPTNPLIVLNEGRISLKKYKKTNKFFDKQKAIFLFSKAQKMDSSEIGKIAKKYLEELKNNNPNNEETN